MDLHRHHIKRRSREPTAPTVLLQSLTRYLIHAIHLAHQSTNLCLVHIPHVPTTCRPFLTQHRWIRPHLVLHRISITQHPQRQPRHNTYHFHALTHRLRRLCYRPSAHWANLGLPCHHHHHILHNILPIICTNGDLHTTQLRRQSQSGRMRTRLAVTMRAHITKASALLKMITLACTAMPILSTIGAVLRLSLAVLQTNAQLSRPTNLSGSVHRWNTDVQMAECQARSS